MNEVNNIISKIASIATDMNLIGIGIILIALMCIYFKYITINTFK